jgi:hypothetical protein
MSYRQYTECISPDDFNGAPVPYSAALGMFVGLTALVVSMLATGGISGLLVGSTIGIALTTGLLSWVHWWLYGRLICLGGERCVIGMVISVEPPSEKSSLPPPLAFEQLDSDYSFNLLLPPLLPGASQADVIATGVGGYLIAEQDATRQRHLDFQGESARSCDSEKCGTAGCPDTAALHCEFEGAGMYIFYQWLKALLALFIAATVASALCLVPVIGWVACVIAIILLSLAGASLLAGLIHGQLDAASPSDVNPALGSELHQNDCFGLGADLLVVSGEWVYDSLHEGWNEIHPIRHCQRIGTWNGTWPFTTQAEREVWCRAIGSVGTPLTTSNQNEPENKWTVHPWVDGCEPEGCRILLTEVLAVGDPMATSIVVTGTASGCETLEVSVRCAGDDTSVVKVTVSAHGMWSAEIDASGLDCKCGGPATVTVQCAENPDCVTEYETNDLHCVGHE